MPPTTSFNVLKNGGNPYTVVLDRREGNLFIVDNWENRLVKFGKEVRLKVQDFWVGISEKNEMTEFSGGYGPQFDGNSILARINATEFLFAGQSVFYFQSKSPIIVYHSPVGNSRAPYPYAMNADHDIFLLSYNTVMLNVPESGRKDPHEYFSSIRECSFTFAGRMFRYRWDPDPGALYDRVLVKEPDGKYISKRNFIQEMRKSKPTLKAITKKFLAKEARD